MNAKAVRVTLEALDGVIVVRHGKRTFKCSEVNVRFDGPLVIMDYTTSTTLNGELIPMLGKQQERTERLLDDPED